MTIATTARGPTAAEILALLASIECHPVNAPATLAFKSALHRKGIEADAIGGLAALDALRDAVTIASSTRADARTAILRAAWADLLPGINGESQAVTASRTPSEQSGRQVRPGASPRFVYGGEVTCGRCGA